MKKFSLLIFSLFLFVFTSYSQLCTTDPACLSGICPDSITNLPVTADNVTSYATTVTVVVPKDTVVGLLTLKYSWIRIDSVKGLPPGFTYTCNPNTCIFPGNAKSCIEISGNPMSAGAGTYQIKAYVTAKLTNFLLGTIYQPDSVTYLRVQIDHVTVCGTPTGLASSGVTASDATLSWDDMGATSYKVKYKLSTAPSWTTVNTTSTSVNLSGLTSCSQYKWNVTAICPSGSFKSATKKFNTTGTGCREGIFADTDEDILTVHPNPASDIITINYNSSFESHQRMMIYNAQGKMIKETLISVAEGDNSIGENISDLPSGIYFMMIDDGEGTYISKFIKN